MVTIFTDFDGVLFDTIREAYLLCRKALYDIDVNRYVEKNKFDKFVRYKFLVFNTWQYLYLMKVLSDKHIKSDNEFVENYRYLMKTRDFQEEKNFEQAYLEAKQKLVKENNVLFYEKIERKMPFCDILYDLKDKFDIIVVTRNNKFDVEAKFRRHLVNGFKIYGKEELSNYRSKAEFIAEYMNKHNVKKAYFIDDNSHNLRSCLEIPNLKCMLAGWGNIGINERGYKVEEVINTICKE